MLSLDRSFLLVFIKFMKKVQDLVKEKKTAISKKKSRRNELNTYSNEDNQSPTGMYRRTFKDDA